MEGMDHGTHCEEIDETASCFNSLTEDELAMIDRNKTEIKYSKGETIIKQGTKATNILYLKDGLVKLSMNTGENNLIINIKPQNHFISTENLYGVEFHPYSVTALQDCIVCFLDIEDVRYLIKQNNIFATDIYRVINANVVLTYDRLFSLTQKQLHGRFADILLCLSGKIFKDTKFDLPLSRRDLAALTGMAPESVIRIIKDFKNDKLISTQGKRIEILNMPMLKKISAVG
ncbi:MAG: Crp/Fnr family transcriptional regulator [Bacteroidales bacterium]|nr:Crp/Fnr family transcriptional regulator [Bacteroidales bacterium]